MPGVDTSFYGANPQGGQGNDLVGNVYKMFQMQNMINQNQLFQQDFAAKQAMGPMLQAAVDPNTGEIDYARASVLMSQDPKTAFLAPDFAKAAIDRGKAQADTIQTEIENTIKLRGLISSAIGPIASKGANATQNDLINAAGSLTAELKANGLHNPKIADTIIDVLARAPKDGLGIANYARNVNEWAMSGKERAEDMQGKLFEQDLGGTRRIVRVGPDGQAVTVDQTRKTAAPEGPTDLTRKFAMLKSAFQSDGMDAGSADTMAKKVASGLYVMSPSDGKVRDISTGKEVGTVPTSITKGEAASIVPKGVDPAAAYGAASGLGADVNAILDPLTGHGVVAFPKGQEARKVLDSLKLKTMGTLTEDIPGRPSDTLREQVNNLFPTPSAFSGAGNAQASLKQLKSVVDSEISRIDNDILSPQGQDKFSGTEGASDLRKAQLNRSKLVALRNDYNNILGAFATQKKSQQTGKSGARKGPVDLKQFLSPGGQ